MTGVQTCALPIFDLTSRLPGVFEGNIYPNAVNGSLWTLRYEVSMYVMLAVLGLLCGFCNSPKTIRYVCLLAFLSFLSLSTLYFLEKRVESGFTVPFLWRIGLNGGVSQFGVNFFAGCCLWLFRERLRLSSILSILVLIVAAVLPYTLLQCFLVWLFLPYASIVFAFKAPRLLKRFKNLDYSYGIYIYAFPLQQFISLHAQENGWGFIFTLVLSLVATVTMASFSWHLIEKPSLRFKAVVAIANGGTSQLSR